MANFGALTKYYERVNGFRFPESELRQQREPNPDRTVGKERDFPGGALFMPLLMDARNYIHIPVPALVIFANLHGLETWLGGSTDATVRTAAKSYSSALSALTDRQEKAVENGVPTAHVITLSVRITTSSYQTGRT